MTRHSCRGLLDLDLVHDLGILWCGMLTFRMSLGLTAPQSSLIFSLFLPAAWIDGSPTDIATLVKEGTREPSYYSAGFANSLWKVAYQTLNDVFDDALFPSTKTQSRTSSTSYRYKKDASTRHEQWHRQQEQKPHDRQPTSGEQVPVDAVRDNVRTGAFKNTVPLPRSGQTGERSTRLRSADNADSEFERLHPKPGFLVRLARRFFLGLAIVGAFSFASFGWAVVTPINWMRRRRRGNDEDSSFYTIIVLLALLYGVVR